MEFDEHEYIIISKKVGKSRKITLPVHLVGSSIFIVYKK